MFGDLISLDFLSDAGSQAASSSFDPSLVSEPGFDWGGLAGGFADIGKQALGATLPAAGGAAVGFGLNKLFPGTPKQAKLVDARQQITREGAGMAMDRARNIQQRPESFGLPGDPMDPNSPAGKKRYDIIQNRRSADAARSFNTGGSAARETADLNTQIGNEYNKVWDSSMQTLAGQNDMKGYMTDAQENPWGKVVAGALSPAVSKGLSAMLANWGMAG